MSDDDLWRSQEPPAGEPSSEESAGSGDQPAEKVSDETQPLTGGVPPDRGSAPEPPPGAVPPPAGPAAQPPQPNSYDGASDPYAQPYPQPSTQPYGQAYGQPGQPGPPPYGQPGQPGQPGPYGGPGYAPPPNPYPAPNEYAAPQNPYGAPYNPAYAGAAAPDHPSATTAMVLGIVSLVGIALCGGITLILAPAAWVVGAKAVRQIDAFPGQFGGRDRAQAGKIMGIIGTVLLVLGILAVIAFVAVVVTFGNSDPQPSFPSPTFQNGGA